MENRLKDILVSVFVLFIEYLIFQELEKSILIRLFLGFIVILMGLLLIRSKQARPYFEGLLSCLWKQRYYLVIAIPSIVTGVVLYWPNVQVLTILVIILLIGGLVFLFLAFFGGFVGPTSEQEKWDSIIIAVLFLLVFVLALLYKMYKMPGPSVPTPTVVASTTLGKPTPTLLVIQVTAPPVTIAPSSVLPTASSELPTVVSPTSNPVPATPTPTVAIAAIRTALAAEVRATVLAEASATASASTSTPTDTLTPTAMPTSTPTPTPSPTVPQPTGPITLTIYLRGTLKTDFVTLSSDQPNGGEIYEEGKHVYGNVAVRIGDKVYHSDEELASGEPKPLPTPYRLDVKFSESLMSATVEGRKGAGFDPQKAQFWVGKLDCHSAAPPDKPYKIEMTLYYKGEDILKRTEISFLVADAPGCDDKREDNGGGKSKPTP